MHNQDSSSQNYTELFSKQNLWSNIGIDFQKHQNEVTNLLFAMLNHKQSQISQIEKQNIKQVQTKIKDLSLNFELDIKRKLSKVLFDSSVRIQDFLITKRQNCQLKEKIFNNDKRFQIESQNLQRKITDLETLVKIYQKALINKKMKVSQSLEKNEIVYQPSKHEQIQIKRHKLIKIHVFDIKIEHSPQELENFHRKNLSSSRMSSSFLSRSRHQPQALKDLEKQWNKSVNLSSKSIKSGHKLSVKKDDKNFMKSSMKKQMSRSFIKQNASHACKVSNKQNKLFQSTISEFSIHKY